MGANKMDANGFVVVFVRVLFALLGFSFLQRLMIKNLVAETGW